jgi:hypothetical protein
VENFCWNVEELTFIQGLQLLQSLWVALVNSILKVFPQKQVTQIEVKRIGRPINAASIVCPIVQSNDILSKMFIQKAKYQFFAIGSGSARRDDL